MLSDDSDLACDNASLATQIGNVEECPAEVWGWGMRSIYTMGEVIEYESGV